MSQSLRRLAMYVPLRELTQPVSTWNPSRADTKNSFKYIDLSAIDQHHKAIVAPRDMFCSDAPSRARQLVTQGDILVSTVRPNLNAVARVPSSLHNATASTGFCVLRPVTSRVDPSYLFHWVKTPAFVAEMVKHATGANYPAVSENIVLRSEIPLPPIAEQKRISAILDKADALQAKRRAALAQLGALAGSIFTDLFGHTQQTPVTVGDGLSAHPRGWRWVLLTDVAKLATGHTPDRKVARYWGGNIPWITLGDIRNLDGKIACDSSQKISQAGVDNSSAVVLPPGTVCFSRTASLAFVTLMGREMATSQDFVNWVCGALLDPTYLMHALLRSRERLRALSAGSTHKTIYFPTVERFRVLLPPIEFQRSFRKRIGQMDRLKSSNRASWVKLDELFESLQHRAFRGEL